MKMFRIGCMAAFTVVLVNPLCAAPLPGGAESLVETYQDWVVACRAQEKTSTCVMRQVQSNNQTGKQVLTVEFAPNGRGLDGALLMPFGLALDGGVTLKIDEAVAPGLSFATCLPAGCLAPVSFDEKLITRLKAGTALNASARPFNASQAAQFRISLKGFTTALNRITELTR